MSQRSFGRIAPRRFPALLLMTLAFASTTSHGIDEVVVTATRFPEPQASTLASVTVIARTDIERRQAQTLDELLTGATGIAVSNNGGLGKVSSIFIRGAEADQTVTLVDGVRIGSPTLGSASYQDIPPEQVERVEIVRGPRSALYGSDAIGGVIQIFTRRDPRDGAPRAEVVIGSGSHATWRAGAALGAGTERGYWRVGASMLESEGTNACEGFGAPRFVGCFTDEPDRDGYRNHSASLRGGATFGDATQVEAFALLASGRTEFDSSFANVAEFEQLTVGASLSRPLSSRMTLHAEVGHATDDSENFDSGFSRSRFDTTRDSAAMLLEHSPSSGTELAAGLDMLRDRVDSSIRYVESSRTTVGAFGQMRHRRGAQDWLASVRYDDNEQFGSQSTGSLAWGYAWSPHWRLTLSGGTGFKAPTFNELYFPDFGNPDLAPETSVGIESSLRWTGNGTRAALTLYENRIDDLIGFDASFRPVNIDETRIRGLEAEVETRLLGFLISASAEWLDPENRGAGAFRGNVLPRRSRAIARLNVWRELSRIRFGAIVQSHGRRFDDLANARPLGGYAVVDLLAEWRLTSELRLQARVANALDREYATAAFFPQSGREAHLTIRYAARVSE